MHYLLCTESGLWLLGGLIRLFGGTVSTVWPFSPGNWLGARISSSLWLLSCDPAPVKGFCLFRTPSLPALISFSPTLTTRARPAMPGHSLLGEGSLDPAPIEGGRASLEDLDILQVGGAKDKAPQSSSASVTKVRGGRSWGGGEGIHSSQQM